jgi:hypothetical protein
VLNIIMSSAPIRHFRITAFYAECSYGECCYAECGSVQWTLLPTKHARQSADIDGREATVLLRLLRPTHIKVKTAECIKLFGVNLLIM